MGATRLATTSDEKYAAGHARYLRVRDHQLAQARARYAADKPARQAAAKHLRDVARNSRLVQKRDAFYTERQQTAPKSRYRRLRDYVTSLKQGRPCLDCGGTFPPVVMDFDHVRGVKDIIVSEADTFKRIDREVAKCDLVCANCHRIRTFTRSPIPE